MREKIQAYRQKIDNSRQNSNSSSSNNSVAQEIARLSSLYVFGPNGGLVFNIQDLKDYLDDWYFRDIDTAKDFITEAIDQHYEKFEKVFKCHDAATSGEKSKWIFDYISESIKRKINKEKGNQSTDEEYNVFNPSIQFGKYVATTAKEAVVGLASVASSAITRINENPEERAYHYLGLEDDKDRIIYNSNNVLSYVKDWLAGIETAEGFVVKAIKEDYRRFLSIQDIGLFSGDDLKKLRDLTLKEINEFEDIKNIFSIQVKNTLLKALIFGLDLVPILKNIYSMGIMADIFKQNDIINDQIIDALLTLDDHEISMNFCDQVVDLNRVGLLLFSRALRNEKYYSDAITCLTKLKEKKISTDAQEQTPPQNPGVNEKVIIKLNKEINFDYYISSLFQDEGTLLNLALMGNPQQFTTMFCSELASLTPLDRSNSHSSVHQYEENKIREPALRHRESFYRKLMNHGDMTSFYHYNRCLSSVNKAFGETGLKLIKRPKIKPFIPNDLFPLDGDPQEGKKKEEKATSENSTSAVSTQNTTNGFSNFLTSFSNLFTPKSTEKTNENKTEAIKAKKVEKQKEEEEMKSMKFNKKDQTDNDSDEDSFTLI